MIVEMAGRPAEHLTEALERHIGVLNDVKDIEVHSIKVSEPRTIKSEDGSPKSEEGAGSREEMFTAFAEADFECESFGRLTETMFDFMPSSVEVIEPGKLSVDASELTALLNNISGRLHRYDEIAKIIGERHHQMEGQLKKAVEILKAKDTEIVKLSSDNEKKVDKKVKKKVVKKKVRK